MTPIITERLILRPFTEADLPEFFAIQHDPVVNQFLPWWAPQTDAEALTLLHEQYLDAPDGYALAVCLKATNKVIGFIHAEASAAHDFGYGMAQSAWGHGYMTEAGRALIAQLPVADYPFLTATHDRENPRSGAVMRRLGMTYQYTYLEQWQPKDFPVHFRLYLLNRDGDATRQFPKYAEMYPTHFVEEGLN
ncbi:GNAT family N-acetyltransferase [Lacticaseibacillus kribbianus]|uniref:GNAT family N-acetyltransferase n=1 Tax=Lacticaseibacillus kribbianus TaxID=2926292 RepID=UPI001CD1FC21|nr:GNAT family N-acetyltransferase [Lacticaseibacillus kribbianus]